MRRPRFDVAELEVVTSYKGRDSFVEFRYKNTLTFKIIRYWDKSSYSFKMRRSQPMDTSSNFQPHSSIPNSVYHAAYVAAAIFFKPMPEKLKVNPQLELQL